MAKISATPAGETDDGFLFDVTIDDSGTISHHAVRLSRLDYDRWSSGEASPYPDFESEIHRQLE